jgi:1-phosphatidylinositol-4-phosphate 5-kinase
MLKGYYEHVAKNPNTLLVRFLGLHSLNVHEQVGQTKVKHSTQKLYFVVMANMFNTPVEIHRRYDLKGSWVGRNTPTEKRNDTTVALKDVDFKEAGEVLRVGEEKKKFLLAQVASDSNFLREHGIIDYSLLVGIHDKPSPGSPNVASMKPVEETQHGSVPPPASPCKRVGPAPLEMICTRSVSVDSALGCMASVPSHQRDMGGLLSSDGKSIYFIGLIDILTLYDSSKMLEHHAKALFNDRRGVSCCPPDPYAERFNDFMGSAFA